MPPQQLGEPNQGFPYFLRGVWVPKTYATWADALGIAVGSVKRPGVGRAGPGSAGGGMIFGLWA
jgi:hypothetical protein